VKGASKGSYGINVARLAGIKPSLLQRAVFCAQHMHNLSAISQSFLDLANSNHSRHNINALMLRFDSQSIPPNDDIIMDTTDDL
jgi:DNA mismatch repair ATPase MutS